MVKSGWSGVVIAATAWARNGRLAIVLISTKDLERLEETIDVLSDADAMGGIRNADAAVARGDVVRGVDAVRALRSRRW